MEPTVINVKKKSSNKLFFVERIRAAVLPDYSRTMFPEAKIMKLWFGEGPLLL